MIYVVGEIKEGSSKTTVATNLTVALLLEGRDVLLVDADEQETATDFSAWCNERTGGHSGYTAVQFTVPAARVELKRLSGKYHDVVIDEIDLSRNNNKRRTKPSRLAWITASKEEKLGRAQKESLDEHTTYRV